MRPMVSTRAEPTTSQGRSNCRDKGAGSTLMGSVRELMFVGDRYGWPVHGGEDIYVQHAGEVT
jgi:hypothetical protein